MESPCYRSSYSNYMPSSHYHNLHSQKPRPSSSSSSPPSSRAKKVISIPIHFIGSEKSKPKPDESSALKIQKVFRGFLVRKNLKKIEAIKKEIDGLEEKVQERETMELIKRDEKERLKVSETLMALLIKLDSVRSVSDGVRDCRKAVIRKAIMLQERIDSNSEEIVEVGDDDEVDLEDESKDMQVEYKEEIEHEIETTCDEVRVCGNSNSSPIEGFSGNNSEKIVENRVDDDLKKEENPIKIENETNWECIADEKSDLLTNDEDFVDVSEEGECGDLGKKVLPSNNDQSWLVVSDDGEESKVEKKKMMAKMAEDNERLMALITDLCERNAAQASLIMSLSQRVEQLEKAMSEKAKRKKKKNGAYYSFKDEC